MELFIFPLKHMLYKKSKLQLVFNLIYFALLIFNTLGMFFKVIIFLFNILITLIHRPLSYTQ